MTLATLLCHRDIPHAIPCLQSCLHHLRHPLQPSLRIHEDGTLTPQDIHLLRHAFPHATLHLRADTDNQVPDLLRRHPRAQNFRTQNPLALKLLDIPLLAPPQTLILDSDILFLRPFHPPDLQALSAAGQFLFMRDHNQGYSARLIHLVRHHRLPLASRVNAGVIHCPPGAHDLDFIEWFLSQPGFQLFPTLIEQTCWAALARHPRTQLLHPAQVTCALPRHRYPATTIAVHFIGQHKTALPHLLTSLPSPQAHLLSPVPLRHHPAPPLNLPRILLHTLRRRIPFLRA